MWKKLFSRTKSGPSAPAGERIYAVGDIHGRADLLDALHERIVADSAGSSLKKTIIYLGDYVDRGADSKGVLDRLIGPTLPGFESFCVKGNHDAAFLTFMEDANFFRIWRKFGAGETLVSYGVKPPLFENEGEHRQSQEALAHAMPESHLSFLKNLPLYVTRGDYVFVHAGLRPGLGLREQSEEDLLQIRDDFLSFRGDLGYVVVHGHKPMPEPELRANRVSVDTGAYATGKLTCAVLEGTGCRFLQVSG